MAQRWYQKDLVQAAFVSGSVVLLVTLVVQFSPKASLEKEVEDLKQEKQRLETQIAPFRALAVERFGENADDALTKLAAQVRDLEAQLERAEGIIRRFDVALVATLSADWKSSTPPGLSNLIRMASRGSDIRVQLQTRLGEWRWLDFINTTSPRMSQGEGSNWVLDYGAEAPAGAWILGAHRADLAACGTVQFTLYGVDRNVSTDGVVSVRSAVLTFHVNGIPTHRCEYRPEFRASLSEEHGSAVKVRLKGPTPIRPAA